MNNLNVYCQSLQAGEYKKEIILETLECLDKYNSEELSNDWELVSETFCQLLKYCQTMYKGNVPEDIIKRIIVLFENIETIVVNRDNNELKNHYILIIWFLHELKVHRANNDAFTMDEEILKNQIEALITELDSIYFVFDIEEENGDLLFPIENLIAKVVKENSFLNKQNIFQIRVLQLAVKLFGKNGSNKEILEELINNNNLRFLTYLEQGYIIDTANLLNYQKNGVMIFFNAISNKILIRHNKKEYFSNSPIWGDAKSCKYELDSHSKPIAYFVELSINSGDCLCAYSDILNEENAKMDFLKILFNFKAYNVLFDKFTIKTHDGNILPVNPYCYNDKHIINGSINGNDGKVYEINGLLEALKEFRSSSLKTCSKYTMNRLSFGLALKLLQYEYVELDKINISNFDTTEWYQVQFIDQWIRNSSDPIKSLKYVLKEWYQENKYCTVIKPTPKNNEKDTLQGHNIEPLDFYPIKVNEKWIYDILGYKETNEIKPILGNIVYKNDNYLLSFNIELDDNMVVKYLNKNNIVDEEGIFDSLNENEECYFLYNYNEDKGIIIDQELLRIIYSFKKMQKNNHLTLETVSKINRTSYESVERLMGLHQRALEEAGKGCFADFDSQVYYRLIHNMLWTGINETNIEDYLNIFFKHNVIDFENIGNDDIFIRSKSNILYIPKDKNEEDSVLVSIYNDYLKPKSKRDINSLYKTDGFTLNNNKYYFNGEEIKEIVFLCDNFLTGSATIRMIKAYLDIDTSQDNDKERNGVNNVKKKIIRYKTKENEDLLLSEVIKINKCPIEVHAYYGTSEGKNKIDSFLKSNNISGKISYYFDISKKYSDLSENEKKIWSTNTHSDFYLVIREFNMPKRNIFPIEMLKDPKKAICMFVLKAEIV